MEKYNLGDIVALKSDKTIKGAVINIIEGTPEIRYQLYTSNGIQTFYASQLIKENASVGERNVTAEEFNAELTASLVRTPTLSSLYSLNSAEINFIPHQFRPVLKLIKSDRYRLLIADGVGVGKTIEAGIILRELQARENLESVLIICPKPLISERKWETEMKRFDEEFTALDGETFRYCIKELDYEGDWPDKYKKCVVPYSLFGEESVMGRSSGNQGRLGLLDVEPPKFDLVIVDEAHHIRNTATYAYKAVERFVNSADAVVFLTATPVQLEQDDLYVLLNLLRPDLVIDRNTFQDMAEPNTFVNTASIIVRGQENGWQQAAHEQIELACRTEWGEKVLAGNPIVGRVLCTLEKPQITAEERVQLISNIENLHTFSGIISRTRRRDIGEFTLRKPITVTVEFTPQQRELHDEILKIMHDMLSKIHGTDNTKFMMTTIRRQTASCLFGLVPMLKEILHRHVVELIDDEECDSAILDGEKDYATISERIQEIIELAEKLPKDDPKFDALLEIVDAKSTEAKNKLMVFSTFRHTLNYLYAKLNARGYRVGLIDGTVQDEDRRDLRDRFNPAITPIDDGRAIDVLLFSEVGCEGLDYQFCDCMVNYDLPWNPMRVEQRIGRIDRNGQTSDSVAIYNMITPGTVDADIYERCLWRIGVFQESIGDCEEILGEVTSEINRIAENFEMTEEERQEKLQQLADNNVRLIKEQEALEEKQRDLFGIHIPQEVFEDEVKDATNFWLSPEKLQNLVSIYIKARTGEDKEYFSGEKSLKNLRLSREAKTMLLDDFNNARFPRDKKTKAWKTRLETGDPNIKVTFDIFCSRENPDAMFISVTHPLIKQAAAFLKDHNKPVTTLKVKSDLFAEGSYPFAIYQWTFKGERTDSQLKPVSSNRALNAILLELLEQSVGTNSEMELSLREREFIETEHHNIWEKALAEHRQRTEEMVLYKESSLKTSHAARMARLNETLNATKNDTAVMLTEGKIKRANEDYEMRMSNLQKARDGADITFELLAYGILLIEQ